MTKKLLFLSGLFLALPVFVQAITVGPVRFELEGDPGDVLLGEMSLFNEGGQTQTFYPAFEKFIEKDGRRHFLPNEESLIFEWIVMPESVLLEAGERKKVPFEIKLPENAPPGGHFAVAWWSTAPPDGGPGLGVVARAGILFYLRVSGDIVEKGEALFTSDRRFYNNPPIEFSVVFNNRGNVHLKPTGEVEVKNILGRTKSLIIINPHGFNVLPESSRKFSGTWEDQGLFFGPYKASLFLDYGETYPEKYEKTVWVWLVPWKGVLTLILILLVLGYIIPRGVRRYNEKIIERARRENKL